MTTPAGPYASTAHAYRRAGWAPLPLPARSKAPVPEGWTGRTLAWPSGADVEEWCTTKGDGNVGLRMPPTVLGVDVDAYGAKAGGQTLATLEADLGALPATWRSTSRDDGTSGIRFYLVPAGRRWPGVLGAGIETVRMEHRYAVAWPSIHPDTGGTYRWLTPEGATSLTIPLADTLPSLPVAWLERFGSEALTDMPSANLAVAEAMGWLGEHGGGKECEIVRRAVETANRDLTRGSRHEAALLGANRLVWLASEGHPGAAGGLYSLRLAFLAAVQRDRPADVAIGEWGRLLAGAVSLAVAVHPSVGGDPCKFHDLVPSAHHAGVTEPAHASGSFGPASLPLPMTPSGALPARIPQSLQQPAQEPLRATETTEPAPEDQPSLTPAEDPLEAAWRASLAERFPRTDWHALWADESQEEWLHQPLVGRARSVVIYSPPKVGKSLLALELAVALVTGTHWLGHTPARRHRVLLLDFENSPRDDLRVRLRAMGVEPDDLAELVLLSFPAMAGLDTVRGSQELLAIVELWQPDLVMVDTVSRVIQGEENSNDTWLQIYRLVGLPLKALGIAVLRLDHSGKDEAKGMRGGSAKYGDVDAVWRLSQIVPGSRYRLECTQSRMALSTTVLDLERRSEPLEHVLTNSLDLSDTESAILRLMALADLEGLPPSAPRADLRQLAKRHGVKISNEGLGDLLARRKEAGLRAAAGGEAVEDSGPEAADRGRTIVGPQDSGPFRTEVPPAAHMPRSDNGPEISGPMRTEASQAGPSAPQPYGMGLRRKPQDQDQDDSPTQSPTKGGWRNVGPGPRRWVDFTTGETYDAPPD